PSVLPQRPGAAIPASAETERRVRSNTEARSFRIDMARWTDLDLHVTAAHRVVGAHDLTVTLRSVCQQAESEPMPERRREGNRGDIALIVGGGRFRAFGDEMGSGAEPILTVDRPEAHKRRTRGIHDRRTRRHEPADEVLLRREQLAETDVLRRGLAVQLAAGRVALL